MLIISGGQTGNYQFGCTNPSDNHRNIKENHHLKSKLSQKPYDGPYANGTLAP